MTIMGKTKLRARSPGSAKPVGGFSLIEMMIGLTAGLVVIAAVLSFTVATIQSNRETIEATRMTQDMRMVMNLMMRQVRRAGYDRLAETRIGGSDISTRYDGLVIAPDLSCIVVAHENVQDATDNATGVPLEGEWSGFRRVSVGGAGVVQGNFRANPPDCGSDIDWIDLTSPQQVNITALSFTNSPEVITAGLPAAVVSVTVREVRILLAAQLVNNPAVARSVAEVARIRADEIVFAP